MFISLLQAHREVFEYLIEDFKTYKPLLSAIKNEYEMMLAYQRQTIRELEPLKVRQYNITLIYCHFLSFSQSFQSIPCLSKKEGWGYQFLCLSRQFFYGVLQTYDAL